MYMLLLTDEGQTERQQHPDNDGCEQADVLQQQVLPVVLYQVYAVLWSTLHGSYNHAGIVECKYWRHLAKYLSTVYGTVVIKAPSR